MLRNYIEEIKDIKHGHIETLKWWSKKNGYNFEDACDIVGYMHKWAFNLNKWDDSQFENFLADIYFVTEEEAKADKLDFENDFIVEEFASCKYAIVRL